MVNVYDMRETNFNHNGLRILSPSKCEITEELNGIYELTLEHPINDTNMWKSLLEFNIIKANSQLFRIYKQSTNLYSNGLATRTVYAQHIWYDLAHKFIKYCNISGLDGQSALNLIHNSCFDDKPDTSYVEYNFNHYSDITSFATDDTEYNMISPVACLIGEDNSFVNRLGGELYRNNFYYSICSRKEGSKDNAFYINYGLNMLEVAEDRDFSNFCTYLHTEDNYGNEHDISYVGSSFLPHNYVQGAVFNYNQNSPDALGTDMNAYFSERWQPKVTYTVKFSNLKNTELYKDFLNLSSYNVGDSGIIHCEELGIDTTQKIIKKTVNVLTGETTSITLGNFPNSLIRKDKFENTVSRADNIVKRIISPYTSTDLTQSEFDSLSSYKDKHTYFVYE